MQKVRLYTDGACRGNPGQGGWGVLIIDKNDNKRTLYGAEEYTTNNKMELLAVIEGLNSLKESSEVLVVTDSTYVCKGVTEWMDNWKNKNWRNSSGKPVKNQEYWKRLDNEIKKHISVEWQWVKGHSGHEQNEYVDELANKAIDELL